MSNILQAVETFNISGLGALQNQNAFIGTFNTKYKNIEKLPGQLGATALYDEPPYFIAQDSLVVTDFQGLTQRSVALSVDKEGAVPVSFDAQELIFNIDNDDYKKRISVSAMTALGAKVEGQVASTITSTAYRFFNNDASSAGINSYTQLASALATMRTIGAPDNGMTRAYIPDLAQPLIVGSGLNQFIQKKNDEVINSWNIGSFSKCDFYSSNLLPTHTAGSAGDEGVELTVVSIDSTNTQITVSGGGTASDVIAQDDLLYFTSSALRFVTTFGKYTSQAQVQVRATASADSSSDSMVISVFPALISNNTLVNQNINIDIAPGMKIRVVPSHRRGVIIMGDAGYLAMPTLPDQIPYPTSNMQDKDTKVSLRFTYGAIPFQNQYGYVWDTIWCSQITPDYSYALVFPL